MIFLAKTMTGSLYRVDTKSKIWSRIEMGVDSGNLITSSGRFVNELNPVIGQPLTFFGKNSDDTLRLTQTSCVVAITEESKPTQWKPSDVICKKCGMNMDYRITRHDGCDDEQYCCPKCKKIFWLKDLNLTT